MTNVFVIRIAWGAEMTCICSAFLWNEGCYIRVFTVRFQNREWIWSFSSSVHCCLWGSSLRTSMAGQMLKTRDMIRSVTFQLWGSVLVYWPVRCPVFKEIWVRICDMGQQGSSAASFQLTHILGMALLTASVRGIVLFYYVAKAADWAVCYCKDAFSYSSNKYYVLITQERDQ